MELSVNMANIVSEILKCLNIMVIHEVYIQTFSDLTWGNAN